MVIPFKRPATQHRAHPCSQNVLVIHGQSPSQFCAVLCHAVQVMSHCVLVVKNLSIFRLKWMPRRRFVLPLKSVKAFQTSIILTAKKADRLE